MALLLMLLVGGCGDEPEPPTPSPIAARPTFTPTPGHEPNPGAAGATVPNTVVTAAVILTPTATPMLTNTVGVQSAAAGLTQTVTVTATPNPTPLALERLAQGQKLYRYGDYAGARGQFAALLADPESDQQTRLHAHYELARAYLADGLTGDALATLDRLDQALAATGADPDEFATKDQFLRAEALSSQGEYPAAIAAYWRFLEAYPWMAEIVQARIGAAYVAQGDRAGGATAYRRAADATTDTVAKVRLLETLAQTHAAAGRYTDAVTVYDEILGVAKNAGYRAQIHFQAGQALASAGDLPGAVERWRATTVEAPASQSAYLALVELVNRNIDFDLYQRGYIDLQVGAYLPAVNAYQAYLDSVDRTDSRYGLALHGLGQAYLGAENYQAALPLFERVIGEHGACECLGQAWLDKAATQAALGDSIGARRTYRTFARDHAADPLAAEALWRSGLYALREGNQVEAATDFLTLADGFPTSERAPAGLYAVALGASQTRLFSQAVDLYTRLQAEYPQYKWDAVAYWLGRAYAARGEALKAQEQWQTLVESAPDIYYGILAAYALRKTDLTGGTFLTTMAEIAGPPTRLTGDDGSQAFAERWLQEWLNTGDANLAALPLAVAEAPELRMARLLLDLDQRGAALVLLERLYERHRDDTRALYPLSLEFERLGTYRLSIMAMARLLQFSPAGLVENAPIFLQQRAYPRHFAELIENAARTHGLNPLLYYSLIRQESLFEEGARSSAAAQGLAQIIPDTGRWIAEQVGYPGYTNELVYRPYINVPFGAYYLDWVRDYADNNLVSALVGYNAGPGNVAYWRDISGADDTLFVEILNINEPRLYVQLVTANLYHYTRLYGS
jgi:soluble lytic murein transglycosylase